MPLGWPRGMNASDLKLGRVTLEARTLGLGDWTRRT